MFGEEMGYSSTQKKESSDVYNADVDRVVKEILDVSNFKQVKTFLAIIRKSFATTNDKRQRTQKTVKILVST
jgi:hypothetical protein